MSDSVDNGRGRRRYERLMREIPFNYEVTEGQGKTSETGRRHNGLILDISSGGVRFLAMEILSKNTILIMEFDLTDLFQEDYRNFLPDSDNLDLDNYEGPAIVKGKVMWSTPTAMEGEFEVGVQFIENA